MFFLIAASSLKMVVCASKAADLQKMGMLSSLREPSILVSRRGEAGQVRSPGRARVSHDLDELVEVQASAPARAASSAVRGCRQETECAELARISGG